MTRITVFGVLGFLVLVTYVCAVRLASDQVATLMSVRRVLGPKDDSVLPKWRDNNKNCDSWGGLTCNANGKVTAIYLSTDYTMLPNGTFLKPNLKAPDDNTVLFNGSLSPLLGNLSNLEYLTLTGLGEVSGMIPTSLGQLTNLKHLNVSGNILSGPIPASLGEIPTLEVLDISDNTFEGALPESVGNLTKLTHLDVHGNGVLDFDRILISALNGTIPASLGNLKLTHFDVSDCNFTGPAPIFQANQTSLTFLDISANNFDGALPESIGNLSKLTYLDISANDFAKALPESIGNLSKLTYLDISANNFDGALPESIGNLSKLTYLDMSANKFSALPNVFGAEALTHLNMRDNLLQGPFPEWINKLVNLKTLDIRVNGITGAFNVSALTQIEYLDLSYNALELSTGLPDYFGTFTKATFIALDYVKFQGTIPAAFSSMKSLAQFSCVFCGLTGSFPTTIINPSLEDISLALNELMGPISSTLCKLRNLANLDLSSNQLNGSIPECLGELETLETLLLYNNTLSGNIPASLTLHPSLMNLNLQGNGLDGDIPLFGSQLSELDLSNNSFTGLPFYNLTSLKSLTSLSLSFNNFFSDNIPSEISNMTSLETFLCRSCNLVGSLPIELKQLSSLTVLDLWTNSFSGALPPTYFNNFTSLTSLSISDSSLSGSLPSLTNLTSLTNLDLSLNQFSSQFNISALPKTLVSLNLAGNKLAAYLTKISFSNLENLDILLLDGNSDISGAIPYVNVSVLSLTNTNVSGSVSASYRRRNDSSLNLHNSPACDQRSLQTLSLRACSAPEFSNVYQAAPFCNITCLGNNEPNPYVNYTSGNCLCSGFAVTSLSLLHSPFQVLTLVSARRLQSALATKLDIDSSMLWVKTATTGGDGRTVMTLYLFGPGEARITDPLLSRFSFLWKEVKLLDVPDLGFLDTPNSIEKFDFEASSPPPAPGGPLAASHPPPGGKTLEPWVIAIIIVAMLLLLFVVCLLAFIIFVRKRDDEVLDGIIEPKPYHVARIPFKAIASSTNDFSEDNKLGSGGYGVVFRGLGPDGIVWAVKRAKNVTEKSLQDFENELDILSKVSHSNVVKLLGYCDTRAEQILVYEFMDSGTLKEKLKCRKEANPLSLVERVEIALGAAEGLRYLHTYAERTIIHRDIKSDNILLNCTLQGFQAKIADFGLLKDNEEGFTEFMNTRVAGTTGYIDPEYYSNFKVTRKSDVYSFGVVLLELITGLSVLVKDDTVTEPDETNVYTLVNWVQQYIEDVKKMVDPRLGSDYNQEAMELFVKLAKSCTERFVKYRPEMDEVCYRLTKIKNVILGVSDETIGEENTESSIFSYSAPLPFSNISSASQSHIVAPLSESFFLR